MSGAHIMVCVDNKMAKHNLFKFLVFLKIGPMTNIELYLIETILLQSRSYTYVWDDSGFCIGRFSNSI